MSFARPGDIVRVTILADLEATMVLVDGAPELMGRVAEVVGKLGLEESGDVLEKIRLVPLEGEHIAGLSLDDPLSDLRLTPHRVDGHDAPGYVNEVEQGRNRGDLVGILVGLQLRECQADIRCPRAHRVQDRGSRFRQPATANSLAVDDDGPARSLDAQAGNPFGETALEGFRIQALEYPAQGVMQGNAIVEFEKQGQPFLMEDRPSSISSNPSILQKMADRTIKMMPRSLSRSIRGSSSLEIW